MKIFCDIEPSTYQVQTHNLWFRKLNYVLCNYPNFEQMINLIRISTIIFLEQWTGSWIHFQQKMALLSKGKVLKRLTLCMLQFTILLKLLGFFFYFLFQSPDLFKPPSLFQHPSPHKMGGRFIWVGLVWAIAVKNISPYSPYTNIHNSHQNLFNLWTGLTRNSSSFGSDNPYPVST